LKDYIRLELARRDKQSLGLPELIYLYININNRLYKYKIDTRKHRGYNKFKKNKGRRRENRSNLIKLNGAKKKT